MGLDMYAYATDFRPAKPVDFTLPEDVKSDELHYWRKHSNLHGWMQRLYAEKGGDPNPSSFNLTPVQLTLEDLDRLESDIKGEALPETTGFFFGRSYGDDDEREADLDFVRRARVEIHAGKTVFYDSWW